MTSPEQLLDLILGISPYLVLRIIGLIFLLFYVVFAWVVFRQEKFMSHIVEAPISPLLSVLAQIHFWASVGLFILALFVL